MVNKITNWTFGGFFRTLGRTLAFIVIGLLIGLILQKNDIKIGQLFGIEYVNAAAIENWSVKQVKIQTCNGDGVCSWSSNYDANHNFTGSDMSYPVQALEWRVRASNGLSRENSYNFQFGYKPTPDAIMYDEVFMRRSAAATKEDITCTTSVDSNSYYMWNCTFTPLEDYSSSQYLYIQVHFYQGYLTSINTKITGFDERKGINSIVTQQTNIINNSINNSINAINDINDTIKDDNVNGDTNDMADFITDFEFESQSGISGIMNSFLSLIENGLTQTSSNDWCVIFREKNICLPSGDIIWGRNDVGQFREYFTLIVGGYLFFKMLRSFVFTLDKAIDPKTDKLDVMKL